MNFLSLYPDGCRVVEVDRSPSSSDTDIKGAHWIEVTASGESEQLWSFRGPLGFKKDKILALCRWKIWWSLPRHLRDEGMCPPECFFLLGELDNGQYVCMLPNIDRCGMTFSFSASPDQIGTLCLLGHDNAAGGRDIAGNKRAVLVVCRNPNPIRTLILSLTLTLILSSSGLW